MARRKSTTQMVNLRMAELRQSLGLSQADFGKRINASQSSVYVMENHGYSLSLEVIVMICKRFKINIEWLVFGEGPMTGKATFLDEEKKRTEDQIETLKTLVRDKDRIIALYEGNAKKKKVHA